MNSRLRVAVALTVLCGGVAAAQPAKPNAPDLRRGERLDGRDAPVDPLRAPRTVGRTLLAVPRIIIDVLVWPVVRIAGYLERNHVLARTYWAFTSDDGLIGLRPEVHYETGFLTSLGARIFDRRSLGRGSQILFKLRTGGPRYIRGELRLRAPHDSPLEIELRTFFARDSDRTFGGTRGERLSDLHDAGRETASYGVDAAFTSLSISRPNIGPLTLSLAAEVDLRIYRTSEKLDRFFCTAPGTPSCVGVDETLVPGIDDGMRLLRVRGGVLVDTRRGLRDASGLRLELDGLLAHGVLRDASSHAGYIADLRLFLDLSDRLLTLRLNAGQVHALGDAPILFEELLSPSGTDGLRGIAYGRLRGHSQLFGALEYRWLLAPYLDASAFIDYGGAFGPGFAGLSFGNMIPGYGVGLRVHHARGDYWNAPSLFWIQIAHAFGEGTRFMIGLGRRD